MHTLAQLMASTLLATTAVGSAVSPAAAVDAADLVVQKVVSSDSVSPGESVFYSISVTNRSDAARTVATVIDDLPAGFSYEPGTTVGASEEPTTTTGTLEWPVDTVLDPGMTLEVGFAAYAAEAAGAYPNLATASSPDATVQGTGPTAEVVVEASSTHLTADPGHRQVALSWSSPDPAVTRHRLFWQPGDVAPGFGEGTEVELGDPSLTSTVVGGLENGVEHSFAVFALDDADQVVGSHHAKATPELLPVTDLQASAAGSGAVRLTWELPAGVSEARVRWSESEPPATPADGTPAEVDADGRSATVTDLVDDTSYFFSVFAADGEEHAEPETVSLAPFACPDLSTALDAPDGLVVGSSWVVCSGPWAHRDDSMLDTSLLRTGTQALMTTGDTAAADPFWDGDREGTDLGTTYRGAYDASVLAVDLEVPEGSRCLTLDYAFASDEYPDYVGAEFSDGFVAELDSHDWTVEDGRLVAPGDLALTPAGEPVTVGSDLFADAWSVLGPVDSGTGYGGFAAPQQLQTRITPGPHRLYLSVFDAGDGLIDSAALLDRLAVTPTKCPAVPNETPLTSDDSAFTMMGSSVVVPVLDNDYDPDEDPLTVGFASDGENGTVLCDTVACTYTPNPQFHGTDTFSYTVDDGSGGTAEAFVSVTVERPLPSEAWIRSDDLSMTWPQVLTLNGTVVSDTGQPVPDEEVRLWARPAGGSWTLVDTTTTSPGGHMSLDHRPTKETVYQWRVPAVGVRSGLLTVSVRAAVQVTPPPSALPLGNSVVVRGTASPVAPGARVALQRLTRDGWRRVADHTFAVSSSSVTGGARFTLRAPTTSTGTSTYRVLLPEHQGRLQAVGPTMKVTVFKAEISKVVATGTESLTLRNSGTTPFTTEGWELWSDTKHVALPTRTVQPGRSLTLLTGTGTSTATTVRLGSGPMFGDRHDELFLLDGAGWPVASRSY